MAAKCVTAVNSKIFNPTKARMLHPHYFQDSDQCGTYVQMLSIHAWLQSPTIEPQRGLFHFLAQEEDLAATKTCLHAKKNCGDTSDHLQITDSHFAYYRQCFVW